MSLLLVAFSIAISLTFTGGSLSEQQPVVPVYFVNMESQVERRAVLTETMRKYGYKDVTAVTAFVKTDFDFEILQVEECEHVYIGDNKYVGSLDRTPHVKLNSTRVEIENLCFRKKGRNALVEVAVLFSHLHAIYLAVHAERRAKYALILEDDFVLPFHLDMAAFVAAAPPGFATIQLVTSEPNEFNQNIITYNRKARAFLPRHMHSWCLGAYLIDTDRWRPFIDSVFTFKAGHDKPIFNLFILHWCNVKGSYPFPTVCSPYRFAADYTLYHVFQNDTYITTLPFAESINSKLRDSSTGVTIFNKKFGDKSNLATLARVNEVVDKMKSGVIQKPSFAYQITAL